jgi:class 3 adenylate cyclase
MGKDAIESGAHRLQTMGARTLWRLYSRYGKSYPKIFVTAEIQSAWLVTAGTLALYSVYYTSPSGSFLPLVVAAAVLTGASITVAIVRIYKRLKPVEAWIAGARDPEQTAQAWATAVSLPMTVIRRDMWLPLVGVALPGTIIAVNVLDLQWTQFFPIYAGAVVAIGYSGVLHYFALESGMRPVLIDIAEDGGPPLTGGVEVLSLRLKLLLALPLINIITGLIVAALTSGGGTPQLGVDVLVATGVAMTVGFELAVLLSRSVIRPIRDLERSTEAVRRGDYSQLVPVTNADEFGRLAVAFNQMVSGLAERERLREAFGTYLDEEVAEYILSEGADPAGQEVDVSIVFVDVLGFTEFASTAEATDVVAKLNALFEVIVPIIGRHRGHVDKFVGDGLLAVFGAPEQLEDHADRAVLASVEIAEAVNGPGSALMRVGIGVNSGPVVAGSVGGAGRLNFSVIGDAVNVAARVEEATRRLGDDVLITAETRNRLGYTVEVASRGPQELKGKEEPLELFAPVVRLRTYGTEEGGDDVADSLPAGSPMGTLPGS